MDTTLTFAVAVNDVEQPGAVTVDISSPPAETTYRLTGAWGTISITTAYDSIPNNYLTWICTINGTITPSDTYRFAGVRQGQSLSPYYCNLPKTFTTFVSWERNYDGVWEIQRNVGTVTIHLYTPRVVFNANGGAGAPAEIACRFGVPFVLPTSVPTRQGYAFAGWLPSKPDSNEAGPTESGWYSTHEPYERSGTLYVTRVPEHINALLPVGASARIFRRLRPEEQVEVDKSDIKVGDDESGTNPIQAVTIQSRSRQNLYQCLIESVGVIKFFALWHRCTHKLIRDEEGNLLRSPDGHLLRDD